MRWNIAHVHAFVLVAGLTGGAGACSRNWDLPGSVDGSASASGGRGSGGASGGATGSGGSTGSGGWGTGGANGFPSGTGGRDAGTCGWSNHPADVMFVIGRNSTMMNSFGAATTRMNGVRDAVTSIVDNGQYLYSVNFGYQDFPAFVGCQSQGMCCSLSPNNSNSLIPTPQSGWSFGSALGPCPGASGSDACILLSDSRPISLALDSVRMALKTPTHRENSLYVILLVDGPPACTSEDPLTACSEARTAVSNLTKQLGAMISVVAIGDEARDDPCLKSLAVTAPLVSAPDPTMLFARLKDILDIAAYESCTIDLDSRPPGNTLAISAKGSPIPQDPYDGWSYISDGSTQIQVRGEGCHRLQAVKNNQITITGCPPR